MYNIPAAYFFRLHFERSRFKRRLEDMLLILATEITNIGILDKNQFGQLLDKIIIETAPNPIIDKTVRNQRTEMIRLFGLVKYIDNLAIPGNRLTLLAQTQDTPRFFKSFCSRFQFPGGFLKPDKVSEMVVAGIKFKPAQYILRMFKIANSKHGQFALNAAEVTHFIFNDKRVTVHDEAPKIILDRIIRAREKKLTLDKTSDVIRYARDFLNYMVEANLLNEFKGMYALNQGENNAIRSIISDKNFFNKYETIIDSNGLWNVEDYKKVDSEWTEWFADGFEDEALRTPASALVKDDLNFPDQWKKIKEVLERKDPVIRGNALKELGDEGEKIAYEFEKKSVEEIRPDLKHMVKLVSNTVGLGYDLLSVWPNEGRRKKYIEVKTTKKNHESNVMLPFIISINEWSVADQHGDDFFIYRVIITKEGFSIFAIQNPAKAVKDGKLIIEPIGYKIIYTSNSGVYLKSLNKNE